VRVALALAASIGLAFLVNYLDDRLRSPRQAEQWIGARVLGVIPKE
jgi:capsular polysaccharide biosynthesis protein